MSDDEWIPKFARLALHLPGFGGLHDFDALTSEQLAALLQQVEDHVRRQNKAIRGK